MTADTSTGGAMLSAHATELETSTGRYVDLLNPAPETIHLNDIAAGLSRICRYGGQLKNGVDHYSVAEHSVLVHDLLQHQGAPEDIQIAGLFHDAPEAYLQDMIAPLKYAMRALSNGPSVYDTLTAGLDNAIGYAFELNIAALNSPQLQTADMWALRIEARAITHTGGKHWRWPHQLPNTGSRPRGVTWGGGRRPHAARTMWIARCAQHGITA